MRTLPAGTFTPLLASLGLHACVLLLIAVRRPLAPVSAPRERADAWALGAVEIDAVATPDGMPNIPNADSPFTPSPVAGAAAFPETAKSAAEPGHALGKSQPDSAPLPYEKSQRASRRRDVVPSAASGSAASNDNQGSGKPGTRASTGAFGSTDLPPGVRSLPSAFTRAIPPATGADPIWQTLPTGQERPFTIALRVDSDGHIQDSKLLEDQRGNALPEQFEHFRERVRALLGAGQFSLQNTLTAGYGVFRITIALSDRTVKDEGEPAELVERGFDPPRGAQPGRAYFTLASGRHFEARVEVLNAQRAAHGSR